MAQLSQELKVATNPRVEKILRLQYVGKERCPICPAYAGENAGLWHRKKRTDKYKSVRKGRHQRKTYGC